MPVNLDELNPGTKFPYPKEGAEEWVIIRSLNIKKLQEIMDATETRQGRFVQPKDEKGKIIRTQRLQHVEYTEVTDQKKRDEMTWDYTIVDWKLFDTKGNEIQCTLENKVKLMSESEEFSSFWAECIERLVSHEEQKKEEMEKN